MFFLLQPPALDLKGNPVPAWKTFWSLFGASNQLLAALTLIGVTVWLWQTRRTWWKPGLVTGLPAALMYVMSTWALVSIIQQKFANGLTYDPVPWVAVILTARALTLAEAAWVICGPKRPTAGDMAVAAD